MDRAEESDDALMAAVVTKDQEAFEELMRRHQGWARAMLRGMVRDRDLADDLVQEAFSRVYQHAHTYKGKGSFVGWLRRIAANLAKDSIRKRAKGKAVSLDQIGQAEIADLQPGPASVLGSKWLSQDIRAALETLSEEHRSVIVMRFFGNKSLQEIAAELACPLGTVKSRLHYALQEIRNAVLIEDTKEKEVSKRDRRHHFEDA